MLDLSAQLRQRLATKPLAVTRGMIMVDTSMRTPMRAVKSAFAICVADDFLSNILIRASNLIQAVNWLGRFLVHPSPAFGRVAS